MRSPARTSGTGVTPGRWPSTSTARTGSDCTTSTVTCRSICICRGVSSNAKGSSWQGASKSWMRKAMRMKRRCTISTRSGSNSCCFMPSMPIIGDIRSSSWAIRSPTKTGISVTTGYGSFPANMSFPNMGGLSRTSARTGARVSNTGSRRLPTGSSRQAGQMTSASI